MSTFKKAMIYLGLGPDEEYDAFDDYAPNPEGAEAVSNAPRPAMRAVAEPAASAAPTPQRSGTVRPIAPSRPEPSGSVRVVPSDTAPAERPAAAEAAPTPAPRANELQPAVRIVDSRPASPHAVSPTTFNDAQSIGDRFKSGQAVIVNLQGAERDLRRRLVDFASGLCYALGGKMDRVADQVYLLTPADVEISEADTRRALH
ncbi:MAG: cell division protein SepF [Actinomycetota bacterium]